MFKRSTPVLLATSVLFALCGLGLFSAPAFAYECFTAVFHNPTVQCQPGWEVTSATFPTNLPPGGTGTIEVNVYNVGAAPSSGTFSVTDVLPAGVVATEAGDLQIGFIGEEHIGEALLVNCTTGHVVTCVNNREQLPSLPIPLNGFFGPGAGAILHIAIVVKVEPKTPLGTLTNHVTVAGGGAAAPASTSAPLTVSTTPASSFGFEETDGWASNADGTLDTQAGSHPYEYTYSFDLNTQEVVKRFEPELEPVGGEARDLAVSLPPGIIGNPTAIPECTRQQFEEEIVNPRPRLA